MPNYNFFNKHEYILTRKIQILQVGSLFLINDNHFK